MIIAVIIITALAPASLAQTIEPVTLLVLLGGLSSSMLSLALIIVALYFLIRRRAVMPVSFTAVAAIVVAGAVPYYIWTRLGLLIAVVAGAYYMGEVNSIGDSWVGAGNPFANIDPMAKIAKAIIIISWVPFILTCIGIIGTFLLLVKGTAGLTSRKESFAIAEVLMALLVAVPSASILASLAAPIFNPPPIEITGTARPTKFSDDADYSESADGLKQRLEA